MRPIKKSCRVLCNYTGTLSAKFLWDRTISIRRFVSTLLPTSFFLYVSKALRLQPILKGLPGDADHVADADRLEQSWVCEFIGRSAADTENGCDVIHGVCSALGRPFFVGAHKWSFLANRILKWPPGSPLSQRVPANTLLIRHLKSRCKAAYFRGICANWPASRQHNLRRNNTGRYDMNNLRNGTPYS